ncbi:lysophospholipase/carboxylesterase family protein [Aspergillus costaricaensis CBS 115574]|uniref:Lysophospholipase/carboxylesterase family protein n=1 Tax=Aspergillus costaricaensis CBS 115574 TaxID=1448317 RepID=A0ACD1IFV5_9EURO|nr:lysophospholipase/carboxylesterase family protein [Aspergillus costaricaensis CBS 115574]RAK89307.1 lysophospholipase/carboxylesterase family protein [Aspergillus costaricaensis CBS 115574]
MNTNFPEPHIHLPQGPHTHTAILLHGRGSNGPEFAEELFSSSTSTGQNLPSHLPTWRWVFPTSKDRWSDRFQEDLCAWFDAYSLDDITERQESQVSGLRDSVSHVLDVLGKEIELLNGKTTHVYLGGISQGMASALWSWFCASSKVQGRLGGVLGFCGWMPFAERFDNGDLDRGRRLVEFCSEVVGISAGDDMRFLNTPVLLGHGTDDPMVSVELGWQVVGIMKRAGMEVEWLEYVGAEGDGHWIKAPEGFDAILRFLESGNERVKG